MTVIERPLRLFVGVRVSLSTVKALEDAVLALRRAAGSDDRVRLRWVAPASYHVTLKFLGWTRPETVEALRDRVGWELRGARPIEFETRGLGAFPGPERARVVWAGADAAGGGRLRDLAERVDRAAGEVGFAREKRPFHPHVTLARAKAPGDVRGVLAALPEQTYRQSWVDTIVLFESQVKSSCSEYSEIASWPLESGSKPLPRHTRTVERADEGDPKHGTERPPEDTGDGDQYEGNERER